MRLFALLTAAACMYVSSELSAYLFRILDPLPGCQTCVRQRISASRESPEVCTSVERRNRLALPNNIVKSSHNNTTFLKCTYQVHITVYDSSSTIFVHSCTGIYAAS